MSSREVLARAEIGAQIDQISASLKAAIEYDEPTDCLRIPPEAFVEIERLISPRDYVPVIVALGMRFGADWKRHTEEASQ